MPPQPSLLGNVVWDRIRHVCFGVTNAGRYCQVWNGLGEFRWELRDATWELCEAGSADTLMGAIFAAETAAWDREGPPRGEEGGVR